MYVCVFVCFEVCGVGVVRVGSAKWLTATEEEKKVCCICFFTHFGILFSYFIQHLCFIRLGEEG